MCSREVIVIVNRHSHRLQAQHYVCVSLTPDGAERQGESLAASPTSSTDSGQPDCNVPPPILSPFINVQQFLGHFVQADYYYFFFALQLHNTNRLRVCVVFNQKYSHRLFMSKWRAPSVGNWQDLILICTCVCDFFFPPISTGQSQCKEIPESNTDCLTERHHHHGHRDYRPHRRCLHIQVKKVKREESQSGWVQAGPVCRFCWLTL